MTRTSLKKIFSCALALLLALPANMGSFSKALASAASDDSSISISLGWEESEFKNGTAFDLKEDADVSNAVKMRFGYYSANVREAGYEPGELIVTVKGIGNVNRSGIVEAVVGADKDGASTKTRDWSYSWNRANDTYTLTNNKKIEGNSVLSGYFELVWDINARSSVHGYSQSDIQATLYLPDGSTIQSQTLSFSNETKPDAYTVHIEQNPMYSYEGLTGGIENPDDYAFIRYNLGVTENLNSRGLTSRGFVFNPDSTGVGSGAIVISTVTSHSDLGNGTYAVNVSAGRDMSKQYIYVAYPKAQYLGKTVSASLAMNGVYYEETAEAELARSAIQLTIPTDFSFTEIPGDIYAYAKRDWYELTISEEVTMEKGGDLSGAKLKSGTEEIFYLGAGLVNPKGLTYTLKMVDDFLYIAKNNGDFRQLEAGEYEFKSVSVSGTSTLTNLNGVPIAADTYKALIYTATDGAVIDFETAAPFWEGYISYSDQWVTLPENTTAFAVVFKDLKESMGSYYDAANHTMNFSLFPVKVEFHIKDTSDLPEAEQDNLTSGQVVNTSFIKVYEGDTWINDYFTADNYLDYTNLNLAQKDIATYGSYLDREKANITLYDGSKNSYAAYTSLSTVREEGSRFFSDFTMGSDFTFAEDEYPNRFSLYTVLPDYLALYRYRVTEDIWDVMTLSGLGLSEAELENACTPEVITNYRGSGRTYIALHFDFGDAQTKQNGQIRAKFALTADSEHLRDYGSLSAKSAVIIDKTINEYPSGKVPDDGAWGDDGTLFADIDRDGNTEKLLAYSFASTSYLYAGGGQFQLLKYVKTSYSGEWVRLPEVPYEEYGGEYQYKLSVMNGSGTLSNVVIQDILESGANSAWQGTLQSVECDGLAGTIYYSASGTPGSLDSGNWSTTKSDNTKAVLVDFGDSVVGEGRELSVILNMKAPTDTSRFGTVTENGFTASLTMDESGTPYEGESNLVQVKLASPLRAVVITKTDAESGAKLAGAVFALIDKATGEELMEAESNAKGYAIFHDVPTGVAYVIRETKAPTGYQAAADVDVTLNITNEYIGIQNEKLKGRVEVYKTNRLDSRVKVAGAEYTLYDSDGAAVSTATTDENGCAVFTDILWGSYTVKETAAPAGYQLNDAEYPVTFNASNVASARVINTSDAQDAVFVHLTKYVSNIAGEHTNEPLPGAIFELVRVFEGSDSRVGLYVTDVNGKIDITELPYGDYYLREYSVPTGYTAAENVNFTFSPDNKEANITLYDQRKPGAIHISKRDNLGNPVQDVEFTLYNDAMDELLSVRTNEYGVADIDNREWGTYYLAETDAPDYYVKDGEAKEVAIDANNLSVHMDFVNETRKGAVVLTKTDESGLTALSGARYVLYANDGTYVGTYTTDDNGQLRAENLEWGSYYFKESKAPAGYSLSSEAVRFSVNALNAGLTQYMEITDPLDGRSISLTKRIKAEDINFDNGNPTFIFEVQGTDVNDAAHTYHCMVSFDADYVKDNTDAGGYVSQTVTISELVAGSYTASEVEVSRYALTEIADVTGGRVSGEKVVFDLNANTTGSAAFMNSKYENEYFSDNQNVVNVMKSRTKLTSLKAVYGTDTVEAESTVDTGMLTVTAFYDDGRTKELSESEYTLSISQFPNVNGDYTVTASYTEGGISRSASFTVTIYGMKERIVSLSAVLADGVSITPGSTLTTDMFVVTATYNTGKAWVLPNTEVDGTTEHTGSDYYYYTISPTTAPSTAGDFDATISLNLSAVPNDGYAVSTTMTLTAEDVGPVLETGSAFNAHILEHVPNVKKIQFTAMVPSNMGDVGYTPLDVSAAQNGSIIAWLDSTDGEVLIESKSGNSVKIIANEDCSQMFYNMSSLTSIDFTMLDTSNVIDMSSMFNGCSWLTSLNLSGFRTSNVTNMSNMFCWCHRLNSLDVSAFDTSKVTDMSEMFFSCTGLTALDVSGFDTANVTDMSYMFYCPGLTSLDVSGFNTANVTDMNAMFFGCSGLTSLDVSGFDTAKVTDMSYMFSGCSVTMLDLSGFDTAKVTNMARMFWDCPGLTSLDISSFDTANVTDMYGLFFGCPSLTTLDVSGFNTANVTNTGNMFYGCSGLTTLDLSCFDTANVTNMSAMFYGCSGLTTIDLSCFDTANVTNINAMFYGCSALSSITFGSGWDTSNVIAMRSMFYDCAALTLDCSSWDVSKVTNRSSFNTNAPGVIAPTWVN